VVLYSRFVKVCILHVGDFVVSGFPSYSSMSISSLTLVREECSTHAMTNTIHTTITPTVVAMIIIVKSVF
jgi:hypothetical protein